MHNSGEITFYDPMERSQMKRRVSKARRRGDRLVFSDGMDELAAPFSKQGDENE